MRRSNATTLEDVAREVGVSAMIASVVLNGARSSTRVSEQTRARVLEAAARLRYRPNAVARGLSRRRMDTLGVVAAINRREINLYFLEVLNGILQAAAEHGQNATVFSLSDWKAEESRILEFCDGRVDGMIFIAPHHIPEAFADTFQHHTPFVTLHSSETPSNAYNLDVDNEGGAYIIMQHLIAEGHRRIAHISGDLKLLGAQQRLAGYRRALEEADIAYDAALLLPGDFNVSAGRSNMTALLTEHSTAPLPTAIFCVNDATAYGCMEVLAGYGLRVPNDISIAGFDDTLMARTTTPPLTTMRQPFRQIGQRAVELILTQIQGEAVVVREPDAQLASVVPTGSGYHTEVFAIELVIRGSVGPPPAQPIIPARITALHTDTRREV
jgi:LacI family transcriptional regulator